MKLRQETFCPPWHSVHSLFPLPDAFIQNNNHLLLQSTNAINLVSGGGGSASQTETLTLQYSVHTPNRHLKRELSYIFPSLSPTQLNQMHIVACFFKSRTDLISVTTESNIERDVLLASFLYLVKSLREQLHVLAPDAWLDATDPSSGYPLYSPRGTSLYPDVDGSCKLLKYSSEQAGCCRIILHPSWGTRNYPCTVFTTASSDVIEKLFISILNPLKV